MLDRRLFLQGAGAGLVSTLAGARLAVANAPTRNRLVFIVLRGGLDGLHALQPYADKNYRTMRPTLAGALPGAEKGVIDLNGYFGMHHALAPLQALYDARELVFIPASATQYRQRSHFDGQNMLENGSGKPFGARDGWLNRAITGMNENNRKLGLALGPAVPLILQGAAHVQTWAQSSLPKADEDFIMRLSRVYATDPLFAAALADATGTIKPDLDKNDMARVPRNRQFAIAAKAAAQLLAREDGPRIAVMESQGWDTHFAQETRLSNLLGQLAQGILDLKQGLGQAWSKTAVIVVSEFGRTAAENGSRGTDHGTGGIAMLAGGAVAGGRIGGLWPGLSQKALYEERDVRAVNDYVSLFKAALTIHLGMELAVVEDRIFPASAKAKPMQGLFRAG